MKAIVMSGLAVLLRPVQLAGHHHGWPRRFPRPARPGGNRPRAAPTIAATYPLDDAAQAHRMLEAGRTFGKIVLCP
ncbi:zinc-binding dehydrogenase [Gordonia rhizosphera]|uniref:zinc-binding dehydrogenase n=1 Tax=Gordonia rhizosphera TaxID=83341 RepID=UPI0002D66413